MSQISKFNKNNHHTYVPKDEYHNNSRLLIRNNACQLTVEEKIQSKMIKQIYSHFDFYTHRKYFFITKDKISTFNT